MIKMGTWNRLGLLLTDQDPPGGSRKVACEDLQPRLALGEEEENAFCHPGWHAGSCSSFSWMWVFKFYVLHVGF